jgi:phenylalanine-4-hydroxylase
MEETAIIQTIVQTIILILMLGVDDKCRYGNDACMRQLMPLTHPWLSDAAYRLRRDTIAAQAGGPGVRPAVIDYLPSEDEVWTTVQAALESALEHHACAEILGARARLSLATDRVEQLDALSDRLEPMTGFRYEAVPGLVSKEEFFDALARRRFLSTQFVRHSDWPHYTPEPDVVHEVIGHATCLAVPQLAELHCLAGQAMTRVERSETRQFISDVFWFSGEFGVVRQRGQWKAYGAGLLSSVGELSWFASHASIRPVDPLRMGRTAYDITSYQPTLFGADSLDHLLDVVGSFFSTVSD